MRVDGQLVKSGAEVVTSLPTTDLFYGREVLLSTEDAKYTYLDGNWQRTSGASDVDTFVELTDTPENYTGQADKLVSVKTDESGLEFIDVPATGAATFLDLTDTPSDYTDQENKIVVVNNVATGLTFLERPVDERVKVSSNDVNSNFLVDKLVAGPNISLTENNDGGFETLTISASGGGNGGSGVDPASATGQTIRSTGTLTGEYEWTSDLSWDTTRSPTLLKIGDFGTDIEIDCDQYGDLFVEGSLIQFSGAGTSVETLNVDLDCDIVGTLDAQGDCFFGRDFQIWDVAVDLANFQGDVDFFRNINIVENCEAGSYTSLGVPLSALIVEDAVDEVKTTYQDKYIDSIALNVATDASNILLTFSDLTVGAWYKVKASLLVKWIAGTSARLKYRLKIKDISNIYRQVNYEEDVEDDSTSTQTWPFEFSFQADKQAISIILDTDETDHENMVSGEALALGMTLEEFNPEVREQTTEW